MAQTKYWCFTYNQPIVAPETWLTVAQLRAALEGLDPAYYVFQEELAPTTQRRHYQGYIAFNQVKRKTCLNRPCKGIHLEAARGTPEEASTYCKKDDSRVAGPWEYGQLPENHQGERTELSLIVAVAQSQGISAAAEQYPELFVKYHRGLEALIAARKPPHRVDPPVVHLLFGAAGTGKSRSYHDAVPYDQTFVVCCGSGYWFTGYHGQKHVLLEDFDGRASKWTLAQTKVILDRYTIQVPTKGGFVWWQPEEITITSNLHPYHWFDYQGRQHDWDAIKRRFTDITVFKKGQDPEKITPERVDIVLDNPYY